MTPSELQLLTEPPDLTAELRDLLRQIPRGAVVSFGDLAEALGDLQAARWVATELQELSADEFPIHRVLRRTGKVIGTASLPMAARLERLQREGVPISADSVDLKTVGWSGFVGTKPLVALRDLQSVIAKRLTFSPMSQLPERIAGVDVSYGRDGLAVAAYAVVETSSRQLLFHDTNTETVRFPYIPGYLSYRELPLYLKLLEKVHVAGRLEPWVLVDGNGILHPRRAGIASLLGGVLGLQTVGVSKHRLYGKVTDEAPSVSPLAAEDGEILGFRLRRDSKRSTLYISPGQGIDLDGALRLAQCLLGEHRLPEPIYHADRLSRDVARRL